MDFLEFRWDSRVTTGNSGFLLCWPRKSNLPFELPGRAGDWAPFTEVQTRPHLGLYQDLMFLSIGDRDLGLHSILTQGVRPHLEGKQRTPLSSRVATGISWSPLSGLRSVGEL